MAMDYTALLESAKQELIVLQQRRNNLDFKRAEVDAKILALSKTITAVAPITGPEEEAQWLSFLNSLGDTSGEVGITERIRAIFRGAGKALIPVEIRDQLQATGWDLSKYANAVSTIHTIVKRLVEAGEVLEVTGSGGSKAYRWKGK